MMRTNKDYEKKVHKILKTYNSILVKCKNIPALSDKNIVMVEDINGMINAQIETRKPILYFQEERCISFILLDGAECYVYIVKDNAQIVSNVEHVISSYEYAKNTFVKEILTKIEKVLLSVNNDNEKILTANEIKYLESLKESSEEKSQVKLNEDLNKNSNANSSNEKDKENNLYLVPIEKKKKFGFFNKNKKAKRLNTEKPERKRKIG